MKPQGPAPSLQREKQAVAMARAPLDEEAPPTGLESVLDGTPLHPQFQEAPLTRHTLQGPRGEWTSDTCPLLGAPHPAGHWQGLEGASLLTQGSN